METSLPGESAMMKYVKTMLLASATVAVVGAAAHAQTTRPYTPVTTEMLLKPSSNEWLSWRGTLNNHGYSPLDQINKSNVKDLELAWAYPMSDTGEQETAPLIHDGIMFMSTNNAIVDAVDAKTGDLIWQYKHPFTELPQSWAYQRNQARRQKNGIALYGNKVILTTFDAKIVALDAVSGKKQWEKQVFDPQKGYSYTIGALVVNDVIYSAISGCSIAGTVGGCYITAHDVNTGEELWRFNTLNDPNNPTQQASWGGVPPENRWGGTPWATGAYDPSTNTLFWGIGMPGPYPEVIRGSGTGDTLYTNSTLAFDAKTGKLKWYYQHLPRDNWDLDSPFERLLIDDDSSGQTRRLLVTTAGKNGITFGLDRDTGKYLWSKETIYQNVVKNIDQNGKVNLNPDVIPTAVNQEVLICTTTNGGKLWTTASYSPKSKLFIVPENEACQTQTPAVQEFTPGNAVGSVKTGPKVNPRGIDKPGVIFALSPVDGTIKWKYEDRPVQTASLLATGGGLVIAGDANRNVIALDDETGKVLWKQRLNAPLGGFPATYSIDGVQYLAVLTGYSATAAASAGQTPDIKLPAGAGNSLFVYKLRGK
jgi:PQQ-dependent dehydrogenase (methanol/ethanol family)